jgi:ATP-dependent Clp protease ATP-binding subunit ClpA
VIIIDDFDEVHSSCTDLFTQILKEGKLQMSNGDIADFSNCKFIFTCKADESSSMGFNSTKETHGPILNRKLSQLMEKSLFFSSPLPRDMRRIVYNKLNQIKSALLFQDIEFKFNFKFIKNFVEKNKCDGNCVEVINRAIERQITSEVSKKILQGSKEVVFCS